MWTRRRNCRACDGFDEDGVYDPNLCADTVVRTLQLLSRFTGNERKQAPARPRKPKAAPCRRCSHTEGKSSASLLDSQVTEWLMARGLGRYAAVFADNEVTMDVLCHLTLDDLAEMPIKQVGKQGGINRVAVAWVVETHGQCLLHVAEHVPLHALFPRWARGARCCSRVLGSRALLSSRPLPP
jgi:hypothetical protein